MLHKPDVFIGRYSIVRENAQIGKGSRIWNYCKLYRCQIGTGTEIGSYCEIKDDVIIGDNCVIKSYVSIAKGTKIGNFVFIGPRVTFLNDKHPTAKKAISGRWDLESIIVEDEASIGGSAIILPGIKIGAGAVVGAGSVVTRSVPSYEIWVGNPARFYKKVSELLEFGNMPQE